MSNMTKSTPFALYGNIVYTPSPKKMCIYENNYLVCNNGLTAGIFSKLPEKYQNCPVQKYDNCLIFPGLVDLHIHAPQHTFRGTGMDWELMDWLLKQTFPEEERYADLDYAQIAYSQFTSQLRRSATTRACIFATKHSDATILLMDKMEQSGLISYIGKVNMDRNASEQLCEVSAAASAHDTLDWINRTMGKYKHTHPILTPRFIPCCSEQLLDQLRQIQLSYHLPVQSHLSENPEEVKLVKKLVPSAEFYGDAYDKYGLFGKELTSEKRIKTVMAHCVHSTPEEIQRIRTNGVFVAHCPASNMNLASGIAPIRKYLDLGIHVGLGSDVAGGQTESILRAMIDAIQVSKLYWRIIDSHCQPLTFEEAFYLATMGGGAFFGKVGSFEEDYEFDAIVLDDSILPTPRGFSIRQRVERAAYLALDQTNLCAKYVMGQKLFDYKNTP